MQDEQPPTDSEEAQPADPETPDPAPEGDSPGAKPEEAAEQVESTSDETAPSGTPGIPPPVRDERVSADGIAQTTTTGDPAKDFRGPSVTEEARDALEGDETAMTEPGYADLGHAEDHRVLDDNDD
jgi:hypothetical protein